MGISLGAAAALGASSIVGGVISASAAGSAASTQAAAAIQAAQIQEDMYNKTAAKLDPFVRAGQGALTNYSSLIPGGLQLAPPQGGGPGFDTSGTGAGSPLSLPGGGTVTLPDGSTASSVGSTPAPFTLPAAGQSPFLTNIENQISPESQPLRGVTSFLIGKDPITGQENTALTGLANLSPGATKTPSNLLTAAENFVPGANGTPDPTIAALRGFIPGAGQNPLTGTLQGLLGVGGPGGVPDAAAEQAALEATPGYQFTLGQGLKATQNSYAAQGLGSSGAALKGAASFATGLADTTYNQQLNNYLNAYNSQFTNTLNTYTGLAGQSLNTYNSAYANALNTYNAGFNANLNAYNSQFTNAYNAYGQQLNAANNLLSLGENAGAQTGQIGATTAGAVGNTLTSGAAATAAGIVGSSKAIANSLTGLGTAAAGYFQNGTGGGVNQNALALDALGVPGGAAGPSQGGIYG